MKVQAQVRNFSRADGAARSRDTAAERPSGALWLWAFFGVLIVLLFTNNWTRWLLSPEFVRPDPGPDPYPYLYVLRATEFVSSAVFLYLGWITLLRPWRRNGVPSLDGKLFLGGVFASTLDILFAAFNPTWAMNAHAVAFGTWANVFPGFPGPGASQVPWGLLWCLPAYIWLGIGAAIVGGEILRRLRTSFPRMSTVAMYGVVQLVFMAAFFCLATFWNRTEVYTYVSLPRALTIWYGETWQIPIYEPFCIAAYCLGYTWLRDTRDANGRCAVDREVDRLAVGRGMKESLSTLAVCGYAAVVTIVAYQVPFTWLSMTGDSHPRLPSYLQSGLYCGQPGKPPCPGQYLKQLREQRP